MILNPEESRHAVKVLRLRKGDDISVTDGSGLIGHGIVKVPDPAGCILEINEIKEGPGKRDYWLSIAVSPLINFERFEWFVEKAVEIGVDELTPLICEHSEKHNIKLERLNRIVISAMKQSLNSWRPVVREPVKFRQFITETQRGTLMIAHCSNGKKWGISELYKKGSDTTILIGPEGDFSPAEIDAAAEAGFVPVTLGSSRLRTETAGVVACHSIYFLNQ